MLEKAARPEGSSDDRALSRVRGIVLAGVYPRNDSALDRLSARPLLEVAQQPLVMYGLRWLSRGGLLEATICTNSAGRGVRRRLRASGMDLQLRYLEDWTPRGAAGCVRDAAVKADATTFVVIDGTTVPTVDLRELLEAHARTRSVLTIVVGRDRGTDAVGNERLRPAGLYVFDRSVMSHIPAEGFQDIKERLLPRLHEAGEVVSTFLAPAVSPPAVDHGSYLALNHWALEHRHHVADFEDGFRAAGEAMVHETASVDPGARLLGPVVLGPNVSVQARATVVGPSSIGPGSVVGPDAVVSRSVVWSRCLVGDGAFVDRCTLADGAVVSSRSTLYSALRLSPHRGDRRPLWLTGPAGRRAWAPPAIPLRPSTAGPS